MTASCHATANTMTPPAMRWLDLTLNTPAENLALDHALLNAAEQDPAFPEVFRVWEAAAPFVALGRSSKHAEEVDRKACIESGVPVLRRISGGAAIVTGPGCLMYAALWDLKKRPELRAIDHAHLAVLGELVAALRPLVPSLRCAGTSDVALENDGLLLKCSGNSLRVGRRRLLYHGTLMYDFDLSILGRLLKEPPRQPDYRERRRHGRFVTNLPVEREELIGCLRKRFCAGNPLESYPIQAVVDLAEEKYNKKSWNLQR